MSETPQQFMFSSVKVIANPAKIIVESFFLPHLLSIAGKMLAHVLLKVFYTRGLKLKRSCEPFCEERMACGPHLHPTKNKTHHTQTWT